MLFIIRASLSIMILLNRIMIIVYSSILAYRIENDLVREWFKAWCLWIIDVMFSTLPVIINDFSSCDMFLVLIHVLYKKCTSCVQMPKICTLIKTDWSGSPFGFSYGEYTFACFKYLFWAYVGEALPLPIALCGVDTSKAGYVKARFQRWVWNESVSFRIKM